MIRFEPSSPGTGTAFLGMTPRDYFDEPDASAPTDTNLEAEGLAAWARTAETGATPDPRSIQDILAADELDDADTQDCDEPPPLADDEIFVEDKCLRFLVILGLPRPPDL